VTIFVEVSNTISVPFVTGLQRVARELVAALPAALPGERIQTVRWCPLISSYRSLTVDETDVLAGNVRTIEPQRWKRGVERVATKVASPLVGPRQRATMSVLAVTPGPHDLWLDLEAGWHDPRPRRELLPELRSAGVSVATVVADIFPITTPEWFTPTTVASFSDYLEAQLHSSQRLLCISRHTRATLLAHAASIGLPADDHSDVIRLGADFAGSIPPLTAPSAARPADMSDLLMVATLEPRKNHALALDVFDRLRAAGHNVSLRLIGGRGWNVDDLVRRIGSHPELDRSLRWDDRVSDAELDLAYRSAFLALVPSFAEGFGAPVVEALGRGLPVISSTGGALAEVGGSHVEYASPTSVDEWVTLIARHLDDPEHHRDAVDRTHSFTPATWADSAADIATALAPLL